MSVELETTDETVEDLGQRLGDAIADLPEYEAFAETKATVEADEDLQDEIAAFDRLRQEFVLARQTGEATQEDVAELERAQTDLHARPEMAAFLDAKASLADRLSGINDAISEPLAVDFGGEAGGCCHD